MQRALQRWRIKPLLALATTPVLVGAIVSFHNWHHQAGLVQAYRYPFVNRSTPQGVRTLKTEIAFYQERIRQNPTDGLDRAALASTYLNMARTTGDANWYLLAEQSARQSLTNLPFDNRGAILALARVAEARHQFQETIRLSQQVLQSQPDNEDALTLQVTANLAMGQLAAARRAANTLVDQTPTLGAYTLRALVYIAQGQDQLAEQDFRRALAAEEPDQTRSSAWTRTLLGRFHAQRGKRVLARNLYREALRISPGYPLAMIQLAELETRQGRYEEAEGLYDQIHGSPNSAQVLDHVALIGKAQVKALQGNRPAAEDLWRKAETQFRQHQELDSFGHRRELARLLLARGHAEDLSEALDLMQAEVKIRRDAATLDTLAWALARADRWLEAQQILQTAIAQGIRNASIFFRAGLVEQALGNRDQAIAYFQQAKDIDPTFDQQDRQRFGLT